VAAIGEAREVSTLGADVDDPFNDSVEKYRATSDQLEELISEKLT
jgi:hypothetical protein